MAYMREWRWHNKQADNFKVDYEKLRILKKEREREKGKRLKRKKNKKSLNILWNYVKRSNIGIAWVIERGKKCMW